MQAHCNISIVNNNDDPPLCDPREATAEVAENAPPNTTITTLTAMSEDDMPGRNILYSMVSGNSTLFSVAPTSEVILLGGLDREVVDEYMLLAEACDSGAPQLCCEFNLTIEVTDFDDSPPSFELLLYELTVVVDLTMFTILDDDIGINAQV